MTTSVSACPEISAFAEPIVGAIERIVRSLDGLDADGLNWRPPAPLTNSVYVLAVHTMANAEEFILSMLDSQRIPRDRDAEFAAVGETAAPINARWHDLQTTLRDALNRFGPDVLTQTYTHPRRGTLTGRAILIFVAQHASEHVGHAELTRQLFDASRT